MLLKNIPINTIYESYNGLYDVLAISQFKKYTRYQLTRKQAIRYVKRISIYHEKAELIVPLKPKCNYRYLFENGYLNTDMTTICI